MSKPSFAATRSVNPPGASPILTEAQVWKGLGIKVREPKSFVSVITSCEVVSDDGNKVVRSVRFGESEAITESIELHESTIAYFELESIGTRITNIVSYDENDQMVLTFTFANGIPGFPPGADPDKKELNKKIGGVVEHSIARIRELVKEGVIE